MSERNDQKTEQSYSVDDILAEYSSKSKVLEFPGSSDPEDSAPPISTDKAAKPSKPMGEIIPETRAQGLAARVATLRRKADHYADHMYDRAEPDEETLKAERYIPGVDKEEIPEESPLQPARRAVRRPAKLPADTAATDLALQYRRGLTGRKIRIIFSVLFS